MATIHLQHDGRVSTAWHNRDGKLLKSVPAAIKKAHAVEVKAIAKLCKEIEQAFSAQRARLEASFLSPRDMTWAHWRNHYVDHPLLGLLGRRLIWVFRKRSAWERVAMWAEGELRDSAGKKADVSAADTVTLWHPLASEAGEVQRWRERIFAAGIRQPIRQAFREFYTVTEAERETKLYSNRFAGVLMRQHQLASLCRARGWTYQLMGTGFDGANVPRKGLESWSMHAELYVDLPPDRDPSLHTSALAEQSGTGINLFIGSDQVRFYREKREIAVEDVPALVYSEVMRDVDLFTSVCAVGDDETWSDQGDRGTGIYSDRFRMEDVSSVLALRADMLARALPHTTIADRCTVEKSALKVSGQLGTYQIVLTSGMAILNSGKLRRWLRIPQKLLAAVTLNLSALPLDLDYRTENILRKAHILADDWHINAPELVKQLMPKD